MLLAFCLDHLNTQAHVVSNTATTLARKSTYQSHIKRSLIAQKFGQGFCRSDGPSVLTHSFSHGMCYMEVREIIDLYASCGFLSFEKRTRILQYPRKPSLAEGQGR